MCQISIDSTYNLFTKGWVGIVQAPAYANEIKSHALTVGRISWAVE